MLPQDKSFSILVRIQTRHVGVSVFFLMGMQAQEKCRSKTFVKFRTRACCFIAEEELSDPAA